MIRGRHFAVGSSRPVAYLRQLLLYVRRPCTFVGDHTLLTHTAI